MTKILSNEKKLGDLKVGVVSGSTTDTWLKKVKNYNKIFVYNSRPEAIAALKVGQIEAYISDYIILQGILKNIKI